MTELPAITRAASKTRTYRSADPNDLQIANRQLRRRSAAKIRKLKQHIRKYGIVVPLIVDNDVRVLDGHARLQVALELNLSEVPTVVVEGYSENELRALSISLNRLAEDAEWDREAVFELLTTMIEFDSEFVLEETGFDPPEIDIYLGDPSGEDKSDDLDQDIPPPPEDPVSQDGDVFIAGRHKVGCGDVQDPEVIGSLMGSDDADIVVADPPYNVRIDGHATGTGRTRHREFAMASGELSDAQFLAFLKDCIENHARLCRDGALLYLFIDWRHLHILQTACHELGLAQINLCVWVKTNGGMGSFYRSQHELVFVCRKGDTQHLNNVQLGRHGRNRTNVWQYEGVNTLNPERRAELALHPTVKPVAMIEDAIKDCTRRGDIVLDGFLGSGTTLLAAERSGRTCRGLEIDPGYVDLAIQRWQDMTGKAAVHEGSGLTFAQLREERLLAASAQEENEV